MKRVLESLSRQLPAESLLTGTAIPARYLRDWFGWKHIVDLGDISAARGTEMYLPLWLRLWGSTGTGLFNVRVVM